MHIEFVKRLEDDVVTTTYVTGIIEMWIEEGEKLTLIYKVATDFGSSAKTVHFVDNVKLMHNNGEMQRFWRAKND
jgi:hypothetical protein